MSTQTNDSRAGYVADTVYASTFFRELSPVWLNYVAAVNGVAPRPIDAPFRYLELGCGFGRSAVIHAAACPHGEFHACDASAEHIAGAREYARALGAPNVTLHAATFDALLGESLDPFDYIVLHGVYSWVDAEVRATIRRLIAHLLKPSGLVYVSYNCQPGWASEVPLRRLMVELAAHAPGDSAARAAHAVEALGELGAAKPRYFASHPAAAAALEAYRKAPSSYLAHEFLNEAWEPHFSIDVAVEMEAAGLRYVGSATLPDNHPALLLDDAAAQALARLTSERERTLATDFALDRRFRRDVFVREHGGAGEAAAPERAAKAAELASAIVVGPAAGRLDVPAVIRVPRGELRFSDDFAQALQAALRAGPLALAAAVRTLSAGRSNDVEIARNLLYLTAGGVLQPYATAQHWRGDASARRFASPLVERAVAMSVAEGRRGVLPSEMLGNGVEIEPHEAAAVREHVNGGADGAEPWVGALVRRLARLGLLI